MRDYNKPTLRQAERVAFCRACDEEIHKGEHMVSFYSLRNRGMWVHICTSCVEDIGGLIVPRKHPYIFSADINWKYLEVAFPDGSFRSYQEDGE